MFYSYAQEVYQEIPDEIALAISISGCKLACKGCHSPETWKINYGQELTKEIIENLTKKHKYITTVLFYGGEWFKDKLLEFNNLIKSKGLKTALYTGLYLDELDSEIMFAFDYLKVGRYIEELGGLNSSSTNQRLYYKNQDITYKFWNFK